MSRVGHPGNVTAAFVETHSVGVCRGPYAAKLVQAWHAWDASHGSENDPVDGFERDQLYVVFAVADGGADLERSDVRSFEEARSILLQVSTPPRRQAFAQMAGDYFTSRFTSGRSDSIELQCALALAVAEEACEFEHRDLHWGNILIKRQRSHTVTFRLRYALDSSRQIKSQPDWR